MNSKYSNVLTILLVIIIIAILCIIGFLGYRYVKSINSKNQSEDFVDAFLNDTNANQNTDNNTSTENNNNDNNNDDDYVVNVDEGTKPNDETSGTAQKYKGYTVAGSIEIPATNLKCPILSREEYSTSALATSVCEIYGPGLNKEGNTVISGHNFRNGNFFSNNKKLNNGDKIYITDLTGKRLSYTIYNKYETEDNDSDYMVRDTQGATEISLTTCTDDSQKRIIIWAKADI